jgi:hypothetical protein
MDLATLLSARREADRDAALLVTMGPQAAPNPGPAPPAPADLAAAEEALLAGIDASPAWIQAAVRVVTAHQRDGHGERVWPLLRELEPMVRDLATSDPASAGRVLAALASQALLEGDAEAFVGRARRAVEALDVAGDTGTAAIERAALGCGLLALGMDDEAELALDAAIAGAEGLARSAARGDRARLALRRGANEEARALAAAAVEGFAARGDRRMEAVARATLARALAKLGRGDDALAEARRAREALAGDHEQALADAALACAFLATGRPDDAVAAASSAPAATVGWLAGGAAPVWLALADARAAAGDGSGAAAAVAEAKRAVLAFAYKLRRPALRLGYLEQVPEHRRALGLPPA